ncbi:hypothetical protein PENTCL1PPCAC_889, partial [Pristionchus entomophagus]
PPSPAAGAIQTPEMYMDELEVEPDGTKAAAIPPEPAPQPLQQQPPPVAAAPPPPPPQPEQTQQSAAAAAATPKPDEVSRRDEMGESENAFPSQSEDDVKTAEKIPDPEPKKVKMIRQRPRNKKTKEEDATGSKTLRPSQATPPVPPQPISTPPPSTPEASPAAAPIQQPQQPDAYVDEIECEPDGSTVQVREVRITNCPTLCNQSYVNAQQKKEDQQQPAAIPQQVQQKPAEATQPEQQKPSEGEVQQTGGSSAERALSSEKWWDRSVAVAVQPTEQQQQPAATAAKPVKVEDSVQLPV